MVTSSSRTVTVSRTSSSSSSIDFTANAFNPTEARRTRKRISAAQLAHLEELYRQSSHPTRDQRDALAKYIQMETKSVTIWFQNKRQTDRKVALHNATNSGNVALPEPHSRAAPDITLTAPTSPAYSLPSLQPQGQGITRKVLNEGISRRQPSARPAPLKRALSLASSITSTSTTGSSKTRISLDRVASRSEIRFTHRHPITRSSSSSASLARTSSVTSVTRTSSNSAPSPLSCAGSGASEAPPKSPPSASPRLWETMLSSPLAPSSPPPPEYIAYARARKARTLDWACAAARLSTSEPPFPSRPVSVTGPTFPVQKAHDGATRAREYEDATSVTEDEAELVTPHGSQDASMSWPDLSSKTDVTVDVIDYMDTADNIHESSRGWEEIEMHAALALCGLRG